MKKYYTIILMLILGFSFNTKIYAKKNKKPKWMKSLKSVYPESKYMCAIGEGDTNKQAQQDAAGNLANIFESKITVDQTTQEQYLELSKNDVTNVETSTAINTNINIQSSQTIKNIQFSNSYTNKMGRVMIVAYLNRNKTGNIYSEEIQANADKVNSYIKNSENKSKLRKYSYLNAALVIAKVNETLIEKLQIISSHQVDFLELNYDVNKLTEQVNLSAQNIEFSIQIKNDKDQKIQNVIEEALSQKGFTINETGEYQLLGEIEISNIDLERKQKFVRWQINLKIIDSQQNVLFSFNRKNREGHISYEEAEARAIRTLEKTIRRDFISNLINYLGTLLK